MSKYEFKGVHKGKLQVTEGEVKRRGVVAYFGTDGDGRKGVVGMDMDLVVSEGPEGCDKEGGDIV